jgi:hypothetical protein
MNYVQTTKCQTNPIFEKSKMNLTNYIISSYSNNLRLLKIEKQSQTKPKFTRRSPPVLSSTSEEGLAKAGTNPIKPNLNQQRLAGFLLAGERRIC